jgi:hypothetical protein
MQKAQSVATSQCMGFLSIDDVVRNGGDARR